MHVPVVILAAGASRRLGQPKQLARFRGETLLERSVRIAREAGGENVFVVLGAFSRRILAETGLPGAVTVMNQYWKAGMATSAHAGLRQVMEKHPEAGGVLLMVCDQPLLSAEHLSLLIAAFAVNGAESIVASEYAGAAGIPAVFPRSQFSALLELEGDKGARSLLRNPPCAVILIPFAGGEIDIDSPEDLAILG